MTSLWASVSSHPPWSILQALQGGVDYALIGFGMCEQAFCILLGVNEKRAPGYGIWYLSKVLSKPKVVCFFLRNSILNLDWWANKSRSPGWWLASLTMRCLLTYGGSTGDQVLRSHHQLINSWTIATGTWHLENCFWVWNFGDCISIVQKYVGS